MIPEQRKTLRCTPDAHGFLQGQFSAAAGSFRDDSTDV